jgi:hypothetical protein
MNPDPLPTAELLKTVTAYVVAGGTPHVAAQAAGVPRRVYLGWLRQGREAAADPACRHFRAAVQQAHAQSCLDAEIAVRKNKPLDWLRYGPGKGSPRRPDWTAAHKAPARPAGSHANPLLHPAVQAVFHQLVEGLTPFPEARTVASATVHRAETRARAPWRSSSRIDT